MNSVMEFLYLKWVDKETDKKYVLGALCRDKVNNMYYFKLNEDYLNKAKKCGFSTAVLPFDDVNRIYESKLLFPLFRVRVPDIENYDDESINDLLAEYDMEEYDEFEFLRRTKGISMTDSFILEEERDN